MDTDTDEKPENSLDLLVERYMSLYGNCAQASFLTLQEKYGIECDTRSIVDALTPFPGIGATFETCGAVSGCLISIGLIYRTGDRKNREKFWRCMRLAKDFCTRVVR